MLEINKKDNRKLFWTLLKRLFDYKQLELAIQIGQWK